MSSDHTSPTANAVVHSKEHQNALAEAERHAYSVRQLIGQRTRLLQMMTAVGSVSDFMGAPGSWPLAEVLAAVEHSPAQFLAEIFCMILNKGKRDGFFLEFGACDGELISNTVLLERNFGWSGVLAEPSLSWRDALHKNRHCHIDHRAVHHLGGQILEFAEFSEDDYHTESTILSNALPGLTVSRSYQIETVTLADLLQQYGAPSTIDFISIDVEGGEADILESFPHDQYSFGFLCVEHKKRDTELRIVSSLAKAGYVQVFRQSSGHDGFFVPRRTAEELRLNSAGIGS